MMNRRTDLQDAGEPNQIIDANSPFELYPQAPIQSGNQLKYGVLMIHGLLDSPFTFKDLSREFQKQGIVSKAVLLPGHGTTPSDLLKVSYQDWIKTVAYGVQNLRKEVDAVYLAGYSTGAALSIYHALGDSDIAGIILLAPAVKVKWSVNLLLHLHPLISWLPNHHPQWLFIEKEIDYAKYLSIPINAVNQVNLLSRTIQQLLVNHHLSCPIFMSASSEDPIISTAKAIDFFKAQPHPDSRLILYTSRNRAYADPRIIKRNDQYLEYQINHISHMSIPFSPTNPHYGQYGDCPYASHLNKKNRIYGAYNHATINLLKRLYNLKLLQYRRSELTYNPDFDQLSNDMVTFIKSVYSSQKHY
jgi:esterase/lipase